MPPKRNPLKLNKLQLRTLVLAQLLAKDEKIARRDGDTGNVTLLQIPQAHGDHVHVGEFVVSGREASGLSNPSVWNALARKDLADVSNPMAITVTAAGLEYDTGLSDRFLAPTDH